MKAARVGALSLTLAVSCMSSSSTSFSEGSGSPFATGSTEGRVEGSSDFEVSDVVREQGGTIRGTLTYAGSCDLVKADLRLSYVRGDRILTGKQVGGVDAHFEIGPLAPNEPFPNSYVGENKFAPDAIIFVISNERCA